MDIESLRALQSLDATDLTSTLRSVEINPTELCNRTCVFCPRVDPVLYKNQKLHIDPELCTTIGQQLYQFGFTGRIGFVGFSEPLLHPNIVECVKNISASCPSAKWIEVNTNGDFLTRELIELLAQAGCTNITISMYDNDQTDHFTELCKDVNIELVLRHHYNVNNGYNLHIINRIDIVKNATTASVSRPCYIPFYKLFIDWNGDYLLCEQDWGKVTNQFNIASTSIADFWINKLKTYRSVLIDGNRQLQSPCDKCNIDGTVNGKQSFEILKNER